MPQLMKGLRNAALATLPRPRARMARAVTESKIVGGWEDAAWRAVTGGPVSSHMRPWPVERAVVEAFERTVWAYKGVSVIAGLVAALPFGLKEGENVLDEHPLMRILNGRANPLETGPQLRKRLGMQVLLSKRGAFVKVTFARNGDIIRADLLPPGRTIPIPETDPTKDRVLKGFQVQRLTGAPLNLSVEEVRWFRDPHPLDPLMGMTPLEAAGMSIEMDILARLYNVQFLRNDARPAGIVAIDGAMERDDVTYLKNNLIPGPASAGGLQVVTGGRISYVDLATRPRDLQHGTTAQIARKEVLAALGIGETVVGDASGRTYDNASAELYQLWTITLPPFMDLLLTGWDEDSDDDLVGFFDTSGIEVLQRAAIERRAEARTEVTDGVRTIDEYRELAGLPPFNTAYTRALHMPAGKTIIPASVEDAIALGLGPAEETPAEPGAEPGLDPAATGEPAALPPGRAGTDPGDFLREQGAPSQAPAAINPAPRALESVPTSGGGSGGRQDALFKAADDPDAEPEPDRQGDQVVESRPSVTVMAHLEAVLAASLVAATGRMVSRTLARLTGVKARKGTRHWRPDIELKNDLREGGQVLDAAAIVEVERWQEEVRAAVEPVIASAAVLAASTLAAELTADPPVDETGASGVEEVDPAAAPLADPSAVAAPVVAAVVLMLTAAVASQASLIVQLIAEADQSGGDLEEITSSVATMTAILGRWAASIAVQAATATINGARAAAARALDEDDDEIDIVSQWLTRQDDRVRPTHRLLHGYAVEPGGLFPSGRGLLRYPGDPQAPIEEIAGCRCRLVHRSIRTGLWVADPRTPPLLRAS